MSLSLLFALQAMEAHGCASGRTYTVARISKDLMTALAGLVVALE